MKKLFMLTFLCVAISTHSSDWRPKLGLVEAVNQGDVEEVQKNVNHPNGVTLFQRGLDRATKLYFQANKQKQKSTYLPMIKALLDITKCKNYLIKQTDAYKKNRWRITLLNKLFKTRRAAEKELILSYQRHR